jgi:peptidoglycan/xylan/chitin deacetylase (PgdA/CDA1 family)
MKLYHPRLMKAFLVSCLVFSMFYPAVVFAGQANIFIYHRFGESRYPSTNIDLKLFASHMQYLQDSGKLVLPLSEIVKHLQSGRTLPPGTVALTVDDAFDSFLENAMPILRKHRFPVTLFVNTDGVGGRGYLGWEQIRQLEREGVSIGNHTATHDYLLERKEGESRAAWRKRVRDDISKAQDAFARELGFRPDLFAYPYGEYSPELVAIVRELGFKAAVAQQSGVVSAASDLFLLPRFPMGGPYASLKSFQSKASMQPFELEVLSPLSPVLDVNDPPLLSVKVSSAKYDLKRAQGFVQGNNKLELKFDSADPGSIKVQAVKPLAGRRNKYTLTVPLKDGSGWAWFSYPWFRLKSGF